MFAFYHNGVPVVTVLRWSLRTVAVLLLVVDLAFALPLAAQDTLPAVVRTQVDAVFARWDHTNTPGCALGISQNGHTVYERGYGMAELQYGLAITPQSIFHVASISKQFTAFAVALLAHDGKLSLDGDIRKYLPEIPDYGTVITVRQLMHHVSGLRDQWQLLGYAGWRFPEDLITEQDVLNIVRRQKRLNFTPQSEWLYSNTGFTLLAVIVQRVSGQSLRDFAQQRIFAPLGMTHTHFHDDHAMIVPGRTSAYVPQATGWKISIPDFDTYGATSLFTTTGDLLIWMNNLDHPTVGTAQLVTEAQKSAVLSDGTLANYGYGLSLGTYRGLVAIGHGGADAGYRAQVERYPERGLSIAVLCNAGTAAPNVMLRRVADAVLGTSVSADVVTADPEPQHVSADVLARWVGTYRDTVSQSVLRILQSGDTLRQANGPRLIPTSDTTLRLAGGATTYVLRLNGGRVVGLRQLPKTLRSIEYRREPSRAPGRDSLAAYAGTYYSEELDVRYTLAVRDSVLAVEFRKINDASMTMVFPDGFLSTFGATIVFTRDAKQRITGFTLTDGRVRGVRFDREGPKRYR
jgi:CubicO group peptidase (beta-lactamase class C family)